MIGPAPAQNGGPWDESAITKSWDRVVGDYKSFLNVRMSGGRVDDLPAPLNGISTGDGPEACLNAEPEASLENTQEEAMGGSLSGKDVKTNITVGPSTAEQMDASARAAVPISEVNGQAFSAAASDTARLLAPSLLPPQTVLGGADEGLKKLLMSWYYAGYYTGLYEGQQQAGAVATEQPKPQGDAQDGESAAGVNARAETGEEIHH
ncbi:hypothetical protein SEPCBS57363_005705 [Sporothrix epigloea]|uniref:Survival motor neuron Tudor domain-containing protein n=1 Tax=Sporothrix epigloea TaxID=1892477 RepID=A0ABP0DZE5_9PEZI